MFISQPPLSVHSCGLAAFGRVVLTG